MAVFAVRKLGVAVARTEKSENETPGGMGNATQRMYQLGSLKSTFKAKKKHFFIFHIFRTTARYSKYDFWIPGKFLSWTRKK